MEWLNHQIRWMEVLTMASGRAINGPPDGVPLHNLSDSELERVFNPCCGPKILISAVQAWRDSGHSFVEFMELGNL